MPRIIRSPRCFVEYAHLSPSHSALEACRRANSETAEVVKANPGRFVGVALLPTGHMEDTAVRLFFVCVDVGVGWYIYIYIYIS
jgi:predicted TIM-barrel fold metal-dependent hydrolase